MPEPGWMKDILLPSPREEEREATWVGGPPLATWQFQLETAQTVSFTADRISYLHMSQPSSASPRPRPRFLRESSSTFCPFGCSHDGFNQSFVSLSPLPGLSVWFCIQNVNFDPPTTCQTVDTCVASCTSIQVHIKRCVCVIPNQLHDVIKVFGAKLLCF